jgi:hypothetical protein
LPVASNIRDRVYHYQFLLQRGCQQKAPLSPWLLGDVMPGDPKERRRHSARCAELAVAARSAQLKAAFLGLSKNWDKLAPHARGCASLLRASTLRTCHFAREAAPPDRSTSHCRSDTSSNAPPNHDLHRLDRETGRTVSTPERYPTDESLEVNMGRGLLLWLIGIPIPIIILVWLLGGLHG